MVLDPEIYCSHSGSVPDLGHVASVIKALWLARHTLVWPKMYDPEAKLLSNRFSELIQVVFMLTHDHPPRLSSHNT